MALIDGKFLVHGDEATACVVDLLRKSDRIFGCVHFFDVASESTGTAGKVILPTV